MKKTIEDRNYCVYIHTSPSGKMYVGLTSSKPKERWGKSGAGYLHKNKNGKYKQPAFAYAILKYGWDNFEHEIVANNLTKDEADNLEKSLIDKFNTRNPKYGYNIKEGGSNGGHSEETKRKIGEFNKNKHLSEEHKNKISKASKGRQVSEETRKKISESLKGKYIGDKSPLYGKHHSEEHRRKNSESHKGKNTGKDSPSARKIIQYDLNGDTIKIWFSIIDASRELGLSKEGIHQCCSHRDCYSYCKTLGGFIWRYFEDELTEEYIDSCNKKWNEKSVTQYSLSGESVCVFDNIAEAELKLGVSHSHISDCCRGERKTSGGFIWRYTGEELTKEHLAWCNEKLPNKFSKKGVGQYSLSGEFIDVFESMREAELKTGISYPSISAVCNGRQKTAGGFIWRYYNDKNVVKEAI